MKYFINQTDKYKHHYIYICPGCNNEIELMAIDKLKKSDLCYCFDCILKNNLTSLIKII